jgi:ubiquinone/menaquinone biosynthesis C-methylase UbiE
MAIYEFTKRLKTKVVGDYARLRSLNYLIQKIVLDQATALVETGRPRLGPDKMALKVLLQEIEALYKADQKWFASGQLPLSLLTPEMPVKHWARFAAIFLDGFSILRRRHKRISKEFSAEAKEFLDELPDYYKRNYHFQTDGYLSKRSAEFYDHQVDILFAGATDAMRRLALTPLLEFSKGRVQSVDLGDVQPSAPVFDRQMGQGLRVLDMACGAGSFTKLLTTIWPKAHVTGIDLSPQYLQRARERFIENRRVDFLQANAAESPFRDGAFDVITCVFLFHELPLAERKRVLSEVRRLLKPGGLFVFVDSIQLHDKPKLEEALRQFPKDFHEPFYRNYIETPMETLFEVADLLPQHQSTGFLAKCIGAAPTGG